MIKQQKTIILSAYTGIYDLVVLKARYNQKSPCEILQERSKKLRK